jgi:hypothetical protein
MSSPTNTHRYELKLVAWEQERAAIEHWLRMHPSAFRQAYPDRWVNNIYFDKFEYEALQANIRGDCERSKLRYRWYGSKDAISTGTLEVKQKRDKLGWKLRYEIASAPAEPSDDWFRIKKKLRAQLPVEGRLWLDEYPMPILINRYHRAYLVSSDGHVRATIDSRQSVCGQAHGRRPNLRRASELPRALVIEIKADEEHREKVAELLQGLPLRAGRNSKYVSGVRSILPD